MDNTHRDRDDFIAALRECATFLESHPEVTPPRYITMNVFVNSREDLAVNAKAATWEKVYGDKWFNLRRVFGSLENLALEITAPRETVCRKVVTGTREVPAMPATAAHTVEEFGWVCEEPSLLAAASPRT